MYMVLVDREIRERVDHANLIDSYDPRCLTNIGYDLRARQFTVGGEMKESVTLNPGESTFVEPAESVNMPTDLMGQVVLKNSRIRQGLTLEAPFYQPGHQTRVYFRLTNVSAESITLEADQKYATIVFQKLSQEPEQPYDGKFQKEFNFRGMGDYQDVYKRQMKELEQKQHDIKELEGTIYANVLTILSIFVALFAIVTINVNLTANSATVQMYFVFNALVLGCVSFLAALLNTVVKDRPFRLSHWLPAIAAFMAAVAAKFLLK